MKKSLLTLFSAIAAMLLLGSCTEDIDVKMLPGYWQVDKATTVTASDGSGEIKMNVYYVFEEPDAQNKGLAYVIHDGVQSGKDEFDIDFKINFHYTIQAKYEVSGSDIKLTYVPDSSDVDVEIGDVIEIGNKHIEAIAQGKMENPFPEVKATKDNLKEYSYHVYQANLAFFDEYFSKEFKERGSEILTSTVIEGDKMNFYQSGENVKLTRLKKNEEAAEEAPAAEAPAESGE
ncbi:MAG: hypothetical protein J6X81_03135 [Muribaculaceae bacterium]|nr:hypothetical protein [Muribaculaceae bacterium]